MNCFRKLTNANFHTFIFLFSFLLISSSPFPTPPCSSSLVPTKDCSISSKSLDNGHSEKPSLDYKGEFSSSTTKPATLRVPADEHRERINLLKSLLFLCASHLLCLMFLFHKINIKLSCLSLTTFILPPIVSNVQSMKSKRSPLSKMELVLDFPLMVAMTRRLAIGLLLLRKFSWVRRKPNRNFTCTI